MSKSAMSNSAIRCIVLFCSMSVFQSALTIVAADRVVGQESTNTSAGASTSASDTPPAANSAAANWTRFRGENGSGYVPDCKVALPWKAEDVTWSVDLPGSGNGSPIVFGDKVFLMSAEPESAMRLLLALDLKTGKLLWNQTRESAPHHLHLRSSYASCTPCANENAVFFVWASPQSVVLAAFDHAGQELWTQDLGTFVSQHGFGASPTLIGGKLILFNSQQGERLPADTEPGASQVVAFDPATGNVLWTTPVESTRSCYGVPAHYRDAEGNDALIIGDTASGLLAIDLKDGKKLWNKKVFVKRTVSSPVVAGGLAIGTEGSGGGGNILFAVDLEGQHDVRFEIKRSAPYVPTPVSDGEQLFLWDDSGIVSCVRLQTGEVVWSKRVGGNVSSSPVIAGDKLIGVAEDGTVTILSASETFEKLGSVKLDEVTRATPLVARDYVLIRTNSKLHCIGQP